MRTPRLPTLVLFAILTQTASAAEPSWTIGHQVIAIELMIPGRRDGSAKLDQLIASAINDLADANLDQLETERERAQQTLRTIRDSLTNNGFAPRSEWYPKTLTGALTSSTSVIDCDTSGLIFLSIAERLSLPLSMVEIEIAEDSPDGHDDHNVLRWHLSNGESFDWDIIENQEIPTVAEDKNYGFVWSRDELLGHFHYLRGNHWSDLNRYFNMLSDYERAIELFPRSHKPRNSIAWILSTVGELQVLGRQNDALRLAKEAVARYPHRDNRDTLACAHAINGEFEQAAAIQSLIVEQGAPDGYRLRLEKMQQGRNCLGE